ncbi:MAG: hypothetical protein RLN60_05520 [Phycisphaerales bacterium]
MSTLRTRLACGFVSAAAIVSPLATAPAMAQGVKTMIVVESAGLGELLPSEKDKALRDAIAMIPAKFGEFRATMPELQQIPEFMTDSAFTAISSPWRLAITDKGFDQNAGTPGVGLVMSFRMPNENGKAHADSMHQTISAMMQMSGMPMPIEQSAKYNSMSSFTVPFMFPLPVNFGPRQAGDGWRYEFHVGAVVDPDSAFADLPAAGGTNAVMRGKVDLSTFTPFVNMAANMAAIGGPEVVAMFDSLRESGLIGEDAITVDFVSGYQGNKSVGTFTMRGLGHERGVMMGLTDHVISAKDMAAVPADATFAEIKKIDFQTQWNNFRSQMEQFAGPELFTEVLAQFQQMTGFNFETQVLPSLGDTTVFYLSDSTGGSSWLSTVMAVSLKDAETFSSFWNSTTNIANTMIAQETAGQPFGAHIRHFEVNGTPFSQVQFPGLPVPLEPTFSVAGEWLVIGISPQACHAAVDQITSGRRNITANDAFAKATRGMPGSTYMLFIDSERTLRDGYPYVTMLGSMVANFVRENSLEGTRQGPGLLVPTYAQLADGVSASVMHSYWDGDDYVTTSVSDSSMLVNIASVLGIGDLGDIVSSMLIGGGIGASIAEQAHHTNDWQNWEGEDWDDEWEEHEHEHEHEHEGDHH